MTMQRSAQVSRRITKTVLWADVVVVIVAGSVEWWARLLA